MIDILKDSLCCDKCRRMIFRPKYSSWYDILNDAGWKWCHEPKNPDTFLFCANCTYTFETQYNINHITGMPL